ncbi:MAG: NAD(P)-dependent oxidoreductase [Dehalococcoidia bacterium]
MKALILAPFDPGCLDELRDHLEVIHESWLDTRRLYSPEELIDRLNADGVDIMVVEGDFVFEEVFQAAPSVRFVGICRNATTQVDVDAATEKGVVVVNTPGRNAAAVAELVLGLMLSLARRITTSHNMITSGRWEDPVSSYLELRGTEVAGKTLGIVGLGSIGSMVAAKAGALGMRVIAHDPYITPDSYPSIEVEMVGLEELLTSSDFVSLHLPSGPAGEGIVGREGLRLMRPTAFLINTSTPGAIDQDALVEALKERRIAGAALDVHEPAPLPPNSPLLRLDNVVLTPHIGGATDGTVERHSRMVTEDIRNFLAGRCPARIVNPEAWKTGV